MRLSLKFQQPPPASVPASRFPPRLSTLTFFDDRLWCGTGSRNKSYHFGHGISSQQQKDNLRQFWYQDTGIFFFTHLNMFWGGSGGSCARTWKSGIQKNYGCSEYTELLWELLMQTTLQITLVWHINFQREVWGFLKYSIWDSQYFGLRIHAWF